MDRRESKMRTMLSGLMNAQRRRKRVEASEHVLKTYHESFLYGRVSPSVRVRGTIRGGWLGLLWHFMEFALALASGVLYVYSTYHDFTKFNWASKVQNYISLAFAIDYILRVYSESARWNYIFSFWGLIDLFSAIPIVFFAKSANKNGQFLKLLQFLRIARIISLMNKLGIVGSTVLQQILLLITSTFTAVFLIAGILQYVEYYGASESRKAECPEEGCINFWDAFYFIIVTISTVGYGDITPKTTLGQVVAIFAIMAALSFIPIQIGKITSLASRRPYGGNFNERKITDSRYIIIGGSISFQAVQECLAEFFNPTHCQDLEIYPLRVTILAPFSPSFEMKQLLSLYNGLVEFIEGSPIRQSDLSRVSAKRASVFFLLADKDVEDRGLEDAAQMVKALAVHRYCNNYNTSNTRIIVEILEPETEASAVWDVMDNRGIEVICPTKFHFKMIARSCLVKGLYTFITNLFTSEIKMKMLPANSFVSEYFHSFDNELYPLIFPKACCGMLFEEVVEFVFEEFNVVLFALDVNVMDQENGQTVRKVFLHPKGHVIGADDVGLVICWDLASAYAISKYGDQEMNKKMKWKRKKRVSSRELQKYRTGPIVDDAEDSGTAAHMSYTVAGDVETLESRMRSEISNRGFSERSSRGGGSQQGSSQHGNNQRDGTDDTLESGYGQDGAYASDADEDCGEYPRGVSLERATEMLLAWPPIGPAHVQPHPAVLERRQDVILENLRTRTVPVVSLKVPHILVCCQSHWPDNIFYFIKELRKPDLPNPPIVILHPSEPTAAQWGKVGVFDAVYFLKGSPVYELDLMRGGVLQAEKVVILGFHDVAVELSGEGAEGLSRAKRNIPSAQRSDVDNIVISANVERLVGMEAGVMIIDMQHTFALYYLQPKFEIRKKHVIKADYKRNPEALVHFGPSYMEGKAVSPMLLGFLLRSSFYNKNTVSIVEQLIEGGHAIRNGKLSYQSPRLLRQIAAPKEYWNRQYGDLFVGLLRDKGMLAVGLYRAQGTLGAPTAYVFTNPMKNTVVHDVDLLLPASLLSSSFLPKLAKVGSAGTIVPEIEQAMASSLPPVPRVKLGSQGLEVSALGLGCMGMSAFYGPAKDEDEMVKLVHHAVDSGVTFLDTADAYGPHTNEVLVGKAIKGIRHKVEIATKFGFHVDASGTPGIRGDPEYVRGACEGSLKRLGVDYIDLYYQHRVDQKVPIEVTVGEMKKLVEEGKVKYIGLSEASASEVRRAHAVHPITALQIEWSLWVRDVESEIVSVARELGIGLVPYSPLGRGFFGGLKVEDLSAGDFRLGVPLLQGANLDKNKVLLQRVAKIAEEKKCTTSQLALAWVIQKGAPSTVPIPGTTKVANLDSNISALGVKLTEEEIKALEEAVPASDVAGTRYAAAGMRATWQNAKSPPLSSWTGSVPV